MLSSRDMRLSHKDFDALQRTILELYEYRELETFRKLAPGLFLKIVPADHFCLVGYDLDPAARRARMIDCLESDPRLTREPVPNLEVIVWEHPFTRYFAGGGAQTALMFSDFFSSAQLRNSLLWEPICQVLKFDRNISLPVASSRGRAALSLGRRGKDFTESDRLMLNLLRTHFNQAQRNAVLATARKAAGAKPLAAYSLTPRETEIGHWIAGGKTNPEIAIILQANRRTVEKHMERILEKLGVENRVAAAVLIAGAARESLTAFAPDQSPPHHLTRLP